MPSVSPAQRRLMLATAHGWKKPGGGPSVAVAKDFVRADKVKSAMNTTRRMAKKYAEGGATDQYTTQLNPDEQAGFQAWKQQYAPKDSGYDYDLQGAYRAGFTPDVATGHFDDKFKKPNHPTFSIYSQYAKDRPDLAGTWEGQQYIPPVTAHYAKGGGVDDGESWEPPVEPLENNYPVSAPVSAPVVSKADLVRRAVTDIVKGRPKVEAPTDGQQSLTEYHPTARENLGAVIAGDNPTAYRRRLTTEGVGSAGLGSGISLADATPLGQALGVQEGLQHGDPQEAVLAALPGVPAAKGVFKVAAKVAPKAEAKIAEHLRQNPPQRFEKSIADWEPPTEYPQSSMPSAAKEPFEPFQLMKLNKTHDAYQIIGSVAGKSPFTPLVSGKQQTNIEGFLRKFSPDEIASALVQHEKPLSSIKPWLSDSKAADVEEKLMLLQEQEHLSKTHNNMNILGSNELDEMEQYFAKQETHDKGPYWEPLGGFNPENGPGLTPHPSVLEKAERLGLNLPVAHGTFHKFDAFKLPEELSTPLGRRAPEIGIHFGTVKAAHERISVPTAPNQNFLDYYHGLTATAGPTTAREYNIIPTMIGAKKPLELGDLGSWGPDRMADGLESAGFQPGKINDALNVGNYAEFPGLSQMEKLQARETKQIQNLRKLIESEGYDSIKYKNNVEDPGSTSYIIWHPNRARSFYAKFDEALKHSAHLAAGIGGLSIIPLGHKAERQKEDTKMARGGTPKKKAGGGGVDNFVMHQAARNLHSEGMIRSPVPGRTDKLPMSVPAGAYVLPSDFVSAIGQNNTMAGGAILSKMFTSGPYGMPKPNIHSGRPNAGHLPRMKFADGGEAPPQQESTVPIIAAGGEFVVHPNDVMDIGHGSLTAGHKVLDALVLKVRKEHIRTLRGLAPPKK